jgi:hypothetical protein
MSAVLTRRRSRRGPGRDREAPSQASLFSQLVQPAPLTVPAAPPVAAAVAAPTLDEAISGLWDGLLAGESRACPVCGEDTMHPRHSAASGVVGGRCTNCSATLG